MFFDVTMNRWWSVLKVESCLQFYNLCNKYCCVYSKRNLFYRTTVNVALVHFCEILLLKYKLCADCAKSVGHNLKVSYRCHISNCLLTNNISFSVCTFIYYLFLYQILYVLLGGVNNAPADPAARGGPVGPWGPINVQNTKICCGFFRAGFRSSDRRRCSESLLRNRGVKSLIIIWGGLIEWWVVGVPVSYLCYWSTSTGLL